MKRFIAFTFFFAGGSLLLFLLTLAGCRGEKIVFIYKSFSTEINEDNSSVFRIVNDGDTCSYSKLFTRLQLETTELMAALPLPGNKAYARHADNGYKNLEKVTEIRIIPLYDYSAIHPAGADMADSIWFWQESVPEGDRLNKTQLLDHINRNYNNFAVGMVQMVTFRPMAAPAVPALQRFAIELRTDKNGVLRDTSVTFFLKP